MGVCVFTLPGGGGLCKNYKGNWGVTFDAVNRGLCNFPDQISDFSRSPSSVNNERSLKWDDHVVNTCGKLTVYWSW